MKDGYNYAYLWEEGTGSSCLAIEYVMTNAGPVIIGVLYDGSAREPDNKADVRTGAEDTVRKVVGWFYEEALPIIRERGLGVFVRNTFLQKKCFRDEHLKVVLMFRKRVMTFGTSGILQVTRQGYLLATKDFSDSVSEEEFYRFLGKDGIGEADARLQELGRRAKVRNRGGSYSAVFIENKVRAGKTCK